MRVAERLALAVLIGGFGWGVFTHAADFVTGRAPYTHGPSWANAFWNALVLLDASVVALLFAKRRVGLVAAIALMVADVTVNSYPVWALGSVWMSPAVAWQSAFLGFLIGAAPLLWKRSPP